MLVIYISVPVCTLCGRGQNIDEKYHQYQKYDQCILYFETYETLKQKMIECLICFPNFKIIQTSLHYLHKGIWKSVMCGHKTLLVLGKLPPGAGTVFSSICMKYA